MSKIIASARTRPNRRSFRKRLISGVAVLAVLSGVFVASTPANAEIANTSGSMPTDNTIAYWGTNRTDYWSSNADQWDLRSVTNLCGGYFWMGLNNGNGVYAINETQSLNSFGYFTDTSTGRPGLPAGTFYTETEVVGACGGNGPGTENFTGTIIWDEQYTG